MNSVVLAILAFWGWGIWPPVAGMKPERSTEVACKIFFPNAFSPNQDGSNDVFKPQTNCAFLEYELRIFDRWGNLVYETSSPDESWDGTLNGQEAAASVYIYILQYQFDEGETSKIKIASGDISLLR